MYVDVNKVIVEKSPLGDFYEKYLRFGLVLGQMAFLKEKNWVDYEQLLRLVFFYVFRGIFFLFETIVESAQKRCIKEGKEKCIFFKYINGKFLIQNRS